MKGIETKKMENIGDEKGGIFNIEAGPVIEIPVFYRKKGVVFGNHYHTGRDSSKNPELIFFLKGKIRFIAKNISTGEKDELELESPFELVIDPNIAHAYVALEDVIFIEPRKTKYSENPDTIAYNVIEAVK